MKITKVLAMICLGLTFVSCEKENSDDVNQDKIYTDYEMFYNSNSDKTVVVARFKFGGPTGTNLELTSGAFCLFNGDTLHYNNWYVGHMKEYAGQLNSGTFTYRDVDGNVFVNNTPVYDTIAFDPGFDTIVKSQANTFTWLGNALVANENIGVFVGSWTWGEDALFYTEQDGATSIVLGVNQMSNLAEGTSTVYMDRTTRVSVDQGTSEGGLIKSKFRASNLNVTVVP